MFPGKGIGQGVTEQTAMPGLVTHTKLDMTLEEHAMRRAGMLGSGANANRVFAIDYDSLPPEARDTIKLIISNGPFPYPGKDGSTFGNRFGDLPDGVYLEYTVRTPGVVNRGRRRIVVRKTTAQVFFTACHYERVEVTGGNKVQREAEAKLATQALDAEWRNGFYIVTGMTLDLRNAIQAAIRAIP
jgi:guanyl-specific ribonuclease Sa